MKKLFKMNKMIDIKPYQGVRCHHKTVIEGDL